MTKLAIKNENIISFGGIYYILNSAALFFAIYFYILT